MREDLQFLLTFAFIPARYDTDLSIGGSLPGGFGADLWTFFTYAFLHADLLHIGLNLAWLLPFGTALARRFGTWRYVVFMLVVAAAGAFAHLISHPGAMVPMIGASAAISGAMAAAMRFVFQKGGPLGLWRGERDGDAYRVPAALAAGDAARSAVPDVPRRLDRAECAVRPRHGFDRRGRASKSPGRRISAAFSPGLLLFNAFDPVVPQREFDTERERLIRRTTPPPHSCAMIDAESALVLWATQARLDAAPQRGAGRRGRAA